MGYGDEILATGMARGAKDRGKRIAFGDGQRIIFSPWSELIFRHNRNIARPGDELDPDIEWIAHHKGHRLYNTLSREGTRWLWSWEFRATPGEFIFSAQEQRLARDIGSGFVVIEPNVPLQKTTAPNKDWGFRKYEAVATELSRRGRRVIQFEYPRARWRCTKAAMVPTSDIRYAAAILARAALYIGPEGGLHHAAAAVGIPAVVLFGGFVPPIVTGYPTHTNLTGGAKACGKLNPCLHCRAAMENIRIDEVLAASMSYLSAPREVA